LDGLVVNFLFHSQDINGFSYALHAKLS